MLRRPICENVNLVCVALTQLIMLQSRDCRMGVVLMGRRARSTGYFLSGSDQRACASMHVQVIGVFVSYLTVTG